MRRRLVPRALVAAVAAFGLLVASAPRWPARRPADSTGAPCADPDAAAAGWQCATFKAPQGLRQSGRRLRQDRRHAPARRRIRQHRIGALFINYGGPGGDAVDTTQAIGADLFGAVNDHFDLVAFDPRGVGESSPSIDCKVNQETEGIYSAPFTTPENLDVNALLAKDKAYVKRCVELNKEHPAVRLDRQRRARHGRHPRRRWATRS